MSVSLLEVISSAGFDLNTVDDAQWLLSRVSEFEELIVQAEDLIEKAEDEASV